ncbi:unnamed protein product [Caenorhabditis brenneri]
MGTNGVDSEKFRKKVVNLFPTPLTMCGKQPRGAFIPPIVQSESTEEIDVQNVRLRMSYDVDGGLTRHYSVSWKDIVKPTEEEENGGENKESTVAKESEEPPKVGKTPSIMKIKEGFKTGKIQCDGPCGQTVDVADVAQFGCDHVICDKCRRSQKSTALFDGSPGCCNSECLEKATTDGQKIRSGRRLDSIASSISIRSNEGPWEILQVTVGIIKMWGGHVYRTQLIYEFASQTRVAELTKTIEPYRESIENGRSYFSWQKPNTFHDLQPISLLDTNLRFYNLPEYKPIATGKLYVLIVCNGIVLE